jgi:hypothetical protein
MKNKLRAIWSLLFAETYLVITEDDNVVDLWVKTDGSNEIIQTAIYQFDNLTDDENDSTNILNNLN